VISYVIELANNPSTAQLIDQPLSSSRLSNITSSVNRFTYCWHSWADPQIWSKCVLPYKTKARLLKNHTWNWNCK